MEGQGTLALTRAWKQDDKDDVDASVAVAKRAGGKAQTLESLGWDEALATFRPFLSYNELGSLLEDGPSKLYDALSSVLGLEELSAINTLLVAARKQRTDLTVVAKKRADEIRDALSTASSGFIGPAPGRRRQGTERASVGRREASRPRLRTGGRRWDVGAGPAGTSRSDRSARRGGDFGLGVEAALGG